MKKKVTKSINVPEVKESIESLALDEIIFVDKSMEIARRIHEIMQQQGILQKDLAIRMQKTEAEVSKWLSGLHNYTLRSLSKVEAALNCQVMYVPKIITTPPMTYHNKFTIEEVGHNTESNNMGEAKESGQMSNAA